MNYLAHAYLSFNNADLLVGNMISDYVKGKQIELYSNEVRKGIILHRSLDYYTDSSFILKEAKELFRPKYRLYAGAFIDVILDHFLAKQLAAQGILGSFTQHTYKLLESHQDIFPEKFAKMFPNMVEYDWLLNYQYNWGVAKSLTGLMRRAKYIDEVETAYTIFEDKYLKIESICNNFWTEAIQFAKDSYKNVTNEEPIPYN